MTRPAAIQTPDEGATYWVARRRLGLMSAADEAAFAAWRANPDNAEALADVEGVVDEVGAIAAFSEVRAMREAALTAAGAHLVRMSGSGATCFGLYRDADEAERAAEALAARHPGWFIQATTSFSGGADVTDR